MRPIDLTGYVGIEARPAAESGPAPQLQWIAITDLVVDPAYQRDITKQGRRNVRAIAAAFAWRYFSPVVVAPVPGGRFAIVDGQHRTTAAALCGHESVPCQIIQAGPGEQAQAFMAVNGAVTRVNSLAMHKAALAAGDKVACEIERLASAAGVSILRYPVAELRQKPGQTMAIGALRDLAADVGADAVILGLRGVMETGNAVVGGLTAPIVKAMGQLACLWLQSGHTADDFIAAIGKIVLIREADKAVRNDRQAGEAVHTALLRRLTAKVGLRGVA